MYNITLISTIHKENRLCNSNELLKIIESICPDVIFLEAFEENYTEYDQFLFSQFGVYKERIELNAIQKYSHNHTFKYVPVLDIALSDEFERKIKIVSENIYCQKLLDNYNLEMDGGFQFLNSPKSFALQEEMRELENRILDNETLQKKVNKSIDEYENSMLRNIYSFCKETAFNTAIFLCGVAHRKTIIEKIGIYERNSEVKLTWTFYNDK